MTGVDTMATILRLLGRWGELKIRDLGDVLYVEVPNPADGYYLPKEEDLQKVYETLKLYANVLVYDQDHKTIAAKIWR